MATVPKCRIITVHTFRGDRTPQFRRQFFQSLDDERIGRGRGPTVIECLLFVGHTGLAAGGDRTIFGFNPDGGAEPVWRVMDTLRNGGAYPGIVRDDSVVFAAATTQGLRVLSYNVLLPQYGYESLRRKLSAERKRSMYRYGFPNGDGDCNCTTWVERLGLPLLTGRMDEFLAVAGVAAQTGRRFGACT